MNVPRHTAVSGPHLRMSPTSLACANRTAWSPYDGTCPADQDTSQRQPSAGIRHGVSPAEMESHTFDELDLRLLHALEVDGRASFSRIGAVLGVSDQTDRPPLPPSCAPRAACGSSPSGTPNASGRTSGSLRLRCVPDSAPAIADALARRPDTTWIGLASGGTEVICRHPAAQRGRPRRPAPRQAPAHPARHGDPRPPDPAPLLRRPDRLAERSSARSPRTRSPPSTPGRSPPTAPRRIDPEDEPLVAALEQDGRATYPELQRATGRSESAVKRRLAALLASGAIYIDVEYDSETIGYPLAAALWITTTPAALHSVGETLASHDEIASRRRLRGPLQHHRHRRGHASTAHLYALPERAASAIWTASSTWRPRRSCGGSSSSPTSGPRADPVPRQRRCSRSPPARIAAASASAAPWAAVRRAAVHQDEVDAAQLRQPRPLGHPHQSGRDQPPRVGHHAEPRAGRRDQSVQAAAGAGDPPCPALPLQRLQGERPGDARRRVDDQRHRPVRLQAQPLRADPHQPVVPHQLVRADPPDAAWPGPGPASRPPAARAGCPTARPSAPGRPRGGRAGSPPGSPAAGSARSPRTPRSAAGRAAACP